MDERYPALSDDDDSSPEIEDLLQFLENWLQEASPDWVEAIRYAVIPHSFDLALFSWLRGSEEKSNTLVEALEQEGIIESAGAERYIFDPDLRKLYLRLRQRSDPELYRRDNARAAAFYEARTSLQEVDQIELIYHLLGADDRQGLEAFAAAFEDAWAAYRFGLVELLLQYAREQLPVLGADVRAWIRFFDARLDLRLNHDSHSEERIRAFTTEEVEPRLRAQALMTLATILVETQRWTEALECYGKAAQLFHEMDDPVNLALVFEAQGKLYIHLVASLGGLQEDIEVLEARSLLWLRRIVYAPCLLYRWFSRRIAALPNFYFGADYQEWIIYQLLYRAIRDFEDALDLLTHLPDEATRPTGELIADIQIHLADLYHRVGRWRRAQRLFQQLSAADALQKNDYRRATFELAQGRAALVRSRLDVARECLLHARLLFNHYGDRRAVATTDRLLGDTEVIAGDANKAIFFYAASAAVSLALNDLLASTHIWATLIALRKRFALSPAAKAESDKLEQRLDHRVYIIRFRGALQQQYRQSATRLAAWVIPATFVVFWLIHSPVVSLVFAVIYQYAPGFAIRFGDIIGTITVLVIGLLPALWFYGLAYASIGWRLVHSPAKTAIEQLHTEFVLTTPQGVTLRGEEGQLTELPWKQVDAYASLNHATWRVPLSLFSRFLLFSSTTTHEFDGIARHYQALQKDVIGRLQRAGTFAWQWNLDYSFLGSWWTLVGLLLAILMTSVVTSGGLSAICREPYTMQVTPAWSRYAYVVTDDNTLWAVSSWDEKNLKIEGSYPVPGEVSDLTAVEGYLYLAAGDAGLRVVNAFDPKRLREVAFYDTPGEASGVAATGNYLWIADGTAGVRVLDDSNPLRPVEVGSYEAADMGYASDVAVIDHYAFIAAGTMGVRVLDVSNPALPVAAGFYKTPGKAIRVEVIGANLIVADEDTGLHVLDVSDPAMPRQIATYEIPEGPFDVSIARIFAYIASGKRGVQVLQLMNPAQPAIVSSSVFTQEINAQVLAVGFDELFVADATNHLRLVDVLNPCHALNPAGSVVMPKPIKKITTPAVYSLPLTTIVFEIYFWALLFLSFTGLARLIANHMLARKVLGARLLQPLQWPLWTALLLLSALIILVFWPLTW